MPVLALLLAAGLASSTPQFVHTPCAIAELTGHARCGFVSVPENRAKPRGRPIKLNVIILPATAKETLPPLFDIDGGPGLADTKNAGFYLTAGGAYRAHRPIVMIDQRGTGASNPLNCPELSGPAADYQPMYPPAAVARCRRVLERKADLTQYGTEAAVADLDAVRQALGYDRIDLAALSYGTTVALRYMGAHPERVRVAVLMSVAPPSAMPPREHAVAAERALKLLFARCAADSSCRSHFSPDADLAKALAGLPSLRGAPTPAVFAEKIRSLMYAPSTARMIPHILHQAAVGDLAPFSAATKSSGALSYSDGMYLSVTCSESFGHFDYARAAAAARKTRFGDYRLAQQRAACTEWPKARVSRAFFAPVRAKSAVLIISGNLDPVTPPKWGAEVAAYLPNARQVIIAESGHIFDGLARMDTCFDPLLLAFFDRGDATRLDASCVKAMTPPTFEN
jgi:pimeloyl-ACP methyl ester carboxylesterase